MEICLRSSEAILKGSRFRAKYEVQRIFLLHPTESGSQAPILPLPGANGGIDVVFPVLHGTFGEDGTVQGLLELADLPYTWDREYFASAASMDKDVLKRLLSERGIPIVEYVTLLRGQHPDDLADRLPYPVFVKPANLGSSVGISKVKCPKDLNAALNLAAQFDRKIIVERGIQGREFECALDFRKRGADALRFLVDGHLPSREFYDYEDKYLLDSAKDDSASAA